MSDSSPVELCRDDGSFTATHWSVVLSAREAKNSQDDEALACLCRSYWYPLYAHVRRRGYGHHAAQDLTQEFFSRLLEKHWLDSVSPEKGRFRTFLLATLDHFLANEWRSTQARKRGGGQIIVSLEETLQSEDRFAQELASADALARSFDKTWAMTVLEQAVTQLRQDFAIRGKVAQFEEWKIFLTHEATAADCEASARRLGLSAGAVTVAIHRFRERYANQLRAIVLHTVPIATDVDDELRHLFDLLNE